MNVGAPVTIGGVKKMLCSRVELHEGFAAAASVLTGSKMPVDKNIAASPMNEPIMVVANRFLLLLINDVFKYDEFFI